MYFEKSALACVQAKKSLSAVVPTHPCSENATIMPWYSGGKSRLTNSNKCFPETFWYQITEQKVKINTGQVSRINCQKSFLPIPGETSRLI